MCEFDLFLRIFELLWLQYKIFSHKWSFYLFIYILPNWQANIFMIFDKDIFITDQICTPPPLFVLWKLWIMTFHWTLLYCRAFRYSLFNCFPTRHTHINTNKAFFLLEHAACLKNWRYIQWIYVKIQSRGKTQKHWHKIKSNGGIGLKFGIFL